MPRLSRNAQCPCGTGKKYKKCCLGKVDWERVFRSGEDPRPQLSVRGRNIWFINKMAEMFLLDSTQGFKSLSEYKKSLICWFDHRFVKHSDKTLHTIVSRGLSTHSRYFFHRS